jgi:hypothetical protein
MHNKFIFLDFFEKKFDPGFGFFVQHPDFFQDPGQKIDIFFKQIFFQKIPKIKIYYAKWTMRIEVVNGKTSRKSDINYIPTENT